VLISCDDYKAILDDWGKKNPDFKQQYEGWNSKYPSQDNVPKGNLLVKLSEGVSEDRRNEIMFGI